MKESEPPLVFATWTFKGVRFLGVTKEDNVHVIDEHGNNYGAWLSVERFRARQSEGVAIYGTNVRLTVRVDR